MNKNSKNSLLALGSAAVLAVYAAGFVRTKSAALLFANEAEGRRPASGSPGSAAPAEAPATSPAAAVVAPSVASKASAGPTPAAAATSKPANAAPRTDSPASSAASAASAAPAAPATPANSSTSTSTTPTADTTTTQAPERERGPYRDGVYYGWGSSRHGDIQASVEIRDGRIHAAAITQCLTRYSCSWIAHLQGQVAARQSPEVDYVSGATQSTNAFYYAVVEALKQAK